jgi:hemerythrin HHE cation binding domain-containing protein
MNESDGLPANAIAVLKADHRQVQARFTEFQSTNSLTREEALAFEICDAIRMHADIDESIFYPAFLEATHEEYKHHEAMQEHQAMRDLMDEIDHAGPTEDMFFAKVHVLCEMFEHHVKEEEKVRGIFFEAQHSPLDLDALGSTIQARKSQLLAAVAVAAADRLD